MEVATMRSEGLSNSLACASKILTGLKPKLTYATGRNPPEDSSENEDNSRYPNMPQDRQGSK
jgi:hypothetical protein